MFNIRRPDTPQQTEPIHPKEAVSPETATHVTLPVTFLRQLYSLLSIPGKVLLEDTIPVLFPPPTFSVGELVKIFTPGADIDLMIIRLSEGDIAVIDMEKGSVDGTVECEDINMITEREFFAACKHAGYTVTRANYAKFF